LTIEVLVTNPSNSDTASGVSLLPGLNRHRFYDYRRLLALPVMYKSNATMASTTKMMMRISTGTSLPGADNSETRVNAVPIDQTANAAGAIEHQRA
jgi:hypothetical protein